MSRSAACVRTSVLIAVALMPACSGSASKPSGSYRFPDGSELFLEGTTFGTRHSFSKDGQSFTAEFEKDTLVTWVSLATTSTSYTSPTRALSFDSHGCALISNDDRTWSSTGVSPPWPFNYFTTKLSSRLIVEQFPIGVYPRREPSFTLDFLQQNGTESGAAFEIANPVAGPFPSWNPDPLPSTKTVSGLSISLRSLSPSQRHSVPATKVGELRSNATLTISQSNKPATQWITASVILSDATGNELRWTATGKAGEIALEGPPLCIEEPAWKLRVELARPAESVFPAADVWTVTNVPIPTGSGVIQLYDRSVVGGVSLSLRGIGGSDARMPGAGSAATVSHAIVLLGVSLPCDGRWVTVTATDTRGHRYSAAPRGSFDIIPEHTRVFAFEVPVDTALGPIDLHFAIQRTIAVEFVVKPESSR